VSRRGQLVVLAAAVVAVALLPVLAAYAQLGYQPAADAGPGDPLGDTRRALERALPAATDGVPATYAWPERVNATAAVREALAPVLAGLRDGGPPGVARSVELNQTVARRVSRRACPGGPARQFEACLAFDGVVVQRRANRSHVVAVAATVSQVGPDGTVRGTVVVRR